MKLLSMHFSDGQWSPQLAQDLLKEVVRETRPVNLNAMLAFNDFSGISDCVTGCKEIGEEVRDFLQQASVDKRMTELLGLVDKFVGHLGETSQRLIDLDLEPGSWLARIDAFNWYTVLGDIAENGLSPELDQTLIGWEKVATEAAIQEDPKIEAPPGFEKDPLFIAVRDEQRQRKEEVSTANRKMGLYIMGQTDTARTMHRLFVEANRA